MKRQKLSLLFCAGLALAGLVTPASADHRPGYRFVPDFLQPGAGHFFFDDDEEEQDDELILMPQRRKASIYDQQFDDFYEPRYEPKAKKAAVKVPPVKKAQKPVAAVKVQPVKTQPAKVQAIKAVSQGISCDKGAAVVADYGFSNVEPKACTGKIFTFKAARTGKTYDVSVSSANGEITEVRKVQ
jgi:hypothetical protein